MAKENRNAPDRDHTVFPEIVSREGEVLTPEFVAWALSREGRHQDGREYLNPVPMEPPIGYVEHVPIHEQIARMVRSELSRRSGADPDEDLESEEEANDFDVGDDYEPNSPWEETFHPAISWTGTLAELLRIGAEAKEKPADRGGGGAEPPGAKPKSDAPASAAGGSPPSGDPPAPAKPTT